MGRYTAHLVGESHYQPAVRRLREGDPVTLVAEPDNPHDPRAVRVVAPDGETIGYVERDSWLTGVVLDQKVTRSVTVRELIGGERERPSLGVVLDVRTALEAEDPAPTAQASSPAASASATFEGKSPKQVVAIAVVVIIALLALPSMCSSDEAEAPNSAPIAASSAEQEEDAVALAAEKAKCAELIGGLEATGLIRKREASRITVEDANWAQVPYEQKVSVLIGAYCAETGRQRPEGDERMSAYAYRSGDRLLTLTESGVF